MTRLHVCLLALLPLGACAVTPLPDTAHLNPLQLGVFEDADTRAIQLSAWAFASSGRLRGNPVDAARASASVDYLAGELYASPRWTGISPIYKQQMLDSRGEVRAALGIVPDAKSQEVVDRLTAAAAAIQARDGAGAIAALSSPIFTLGPQATIQRLYNLPFLSGTNVATIRVASDMDGPNDHCGRGCN